MNCRKVSHLLSAYMDGELPGVEHRQIHVHLARCAECRSEYQELLHTKRLIASLALQSARQDLPSRIREQIVWEEAQAPLPRATTFLQEAGHWLRISAGTPQGLAAGLSVGAVTLLFAYHTATAPRPGQSDWTFTPATVSNSAPSVNMAGLNAYQPQSSLFASPPTTTVSSRYLVPFENTSDPLPNYSPLAPRRVRGSSLFMNGLSSH